MASPFARPLPPSARESQFYTIKHPQQMDELFRKIPIEKIRQLAEEKFVEESTDFLFDDYNFRTKQNTSCIRAKEIVDSSNFKEINIAESVREKIIDAVEHHHEECQSEHRIGDIFQDAKKEIVRMLGQNHSLNRRDMEKLNEDSQSTFCCIVQ